MTTLPRDAVPPLRANPFEREFHNHDPIPYYKETIFPLITDALKKAEEKSEKAEVKEEVTKSESTVDGSHRNGVNGKAVNGVNGEGKPKAQNGHIDDKKPPPYLSQLEPIQLSLAPQKVTCPGCFKVIQTEVRRKPTKRTHVIACLLCLVCCCCLPYCMKSCRQAEHYCPECNGYIGTVEPKGCCSK